MGLEQETSNPDAQLVRLTRALGPLDTEALALRVGERLGTGAPAKFIRAGMRPRKAVWTGIGGAVLVALRMIWFP